MNSLCFDWERDSHCLQQALTSNDEVHFENHATVFSTFCQSSESHGAFITPSKFWFLLCQSIQTTELEIWKSFPICGASGKYRKTYNQNAYEEIHKI
jgi:hypothetical protein